MLRYGIALVVAALVVLAGFVFVRSTYAEIRSKFKQGVTARAAREGRPLTPAQEAELDAEFDRGNFGMTLPSGMMIRLDLSMWLAEFWYILIPLVVLACLAAAFLLGRIFRHRAG
jgi:hypothetical protein